MAAIRDVWDEDEKESVTSPGQPPARIRTAPLPQWQHLALPHLHKLPSAGPNQGLQELHIIQVAKQEQFGRDPRDESMQDKLSQGSPDSQRSWSCCQVPERHMPGVGQATVATAPPSYSCAWQPIWLRKPPYPRYGPAAGPAAAWGADGWQQMGGAARACIGGHLQAARTARGPQPTSSASPAWQR